MSEVSAGQRALQTLAGWRSAWNRAREKRLVRWGLDALLMIVVIIAVGAYQTRGHLGSGVVANARLHSLTGEDVERIGDSKHSFRKGTRPRAKG